MKTSKLGLVVAALFCASFAFGGTGTVSATSSKINSPVGITTIEWTSAQSNNWAHGSTAIAVRGEIVRIVVVPGTAIAGGTTAPTGTYNVALTDARGFDVMALQGTTLSATVATSFKPALAYCGPSYTNIAPFNVNEPLFLSVTNCGTNAGGSVLVYVR